MVIVGTQDIYDEQGNLVSSTNIHSNLLEAKKAQIMYCFNLIESFACEKFSPRDREQFLAILARIQILKMQNISHYKIDYVFQVVESWLAFGEDCLLLYETLKQEILAKDNVDDVILIAPDFSNIFIPQKVATGSLIQQLREVS
jgi:hypothetical protein